MEPARTAIITRTRDRPVLVRRAMESVLNQTATDWVHVVVNDGGAVEPLAALAEELASRYQGRLQLLHLSANLGMQAAANHGIRESRSEFLAIHDDDDSWAPDFLTKTVGYLQTAGVESPYQGVITQTEKIWEDLEEGGRIVEVSRENYQPLEQVELFRLGYQNPFPPIAFLFRRAALETVGEFDPRFSVAADLEFNFRFLQRYEIGVLRQTLAFYHWRRQADRPEAHNTVTAGREEHGRRLVEFRNSCLRGGPDGRSPRELGLALSLASILYESQWIEKLTLQSGERNEERLERLWRALGSPAPSLGFESMVEGLAHLLERARDAKLHLTDTTHRLEYQAVRLGDLKAHLGSATGLLEQSERRLIDLKDHLTYATGMLEEAHRALAILGGQQGDLQARLAMVNTGLAELRQTIERVASDNQRLHAETAAGMAGLANEWRSFRRGRKTVLRLGPLAIEWIRSSGVSR